MRKLILLAAMAAMILGTQSCKRSVDEVAKDYWVKVIKCIEDADMSGLAPLQAALDKYCQKLSDDELKEMEQSLQKYMEEMKVDSIFYANYNRILEKEGMEMEDAPDAAIQDDMRGNALPDTLRF